MNVTVHPDAPAWLAGRRRKLTSSDVPGLLGIYPSKQARDRKNVYALWKMKTDALEGKAEPEDDPLMALRFELGRVVEPVIAREVEQQAAAGKDDAIHLIDLGPFTTISDGIFSATLDRVITPTPRPWSGYADLLVAEDDQTPAEKILEVLEEALGLAEFKSDANIRDRAQWADEKLDYATVQLHVGLLVTKLSGRSLVAALFGLGLGFEVYPVTRSEELLSLIRERGEEFWEAVLTGQPPSAKYIDESEAVGRSLRAIYDKEHAGTVVELPEEWAQKIARYEAIGGELKKLNEERQTLKNEAMLALGDHAFGEAPGAEKRWQWKTEQKPEYTVAAKENRVLRLVNARS